MNGFCPKTNELRFPGALRNGHHAPLELGCNTVTSMDQFMTKENVAAPPAHSSADEELQRLNAQLEKRSARLRALYDIGRVLASTLDMNEIYWVMYREIAQGLLGTAHLAVARYDQESKTIHCGFAIVDGEEMDPTQFAPIPLGEGPVSDTIRTRQPRIIDLNDLFPHLQANGRAVLKGDDTVPQSALYVPMVGGDRVVGVMHVQHYDVDAFRETDIPLLSTLASQAAVALTNAELFSREQERADALARALEKQRELERLKNEFLQNVSHELRTPLGIIYGYVELLESGELGKLGPEQEGPMGIVARRVKMLRTMVEDITTILDAETRAPKPQLVDMAELARTSLRDFEPSYRQADLALAVEIGPDLPPVLGADTHLRRVLDNLLGNALKFTPRGGSVTLRLGQEDGHLVLEVTDTGIGIAEDQLDRIFERFYQVDGTATRRYGGTGLGLALVKEIIHAHRGEISVDSTLDEGSTFRVRLPAA
jgi:signal transduction histidine kinase